MGSGTSPVLTPAGMSMLWQPCQVVSVAVCLSGSYPRLGCATSSNLNLNCVGCNCETLARMLRQVFYFTTVNTEYSFLFVISGRANFASGLSRSLLPAGATGARAAKPGLLVLRLATRILPTTVTIKSLSTDWQAVAAGSQCSLVGSLGRGGRAAETRCSGGHRDGPEVPVTVGGPCRGFIFL